MGSLAVPTRPDDDSKVVHAERVPRLKATRQRNLRETERRLLAVPDAWNEVMGSRPGHRTADQPLLIDVFDILRRPKVGRDALAPVAATACGLAGGLSGTIDGRRPRHRRARKRIYPREQAARLRIVDKSAVVYNVSADQSATVNVG